MQRSLDEVREQGLDALRQRLGRADMIRFLQQFETGRGDYARERHAWVDQLSLDEIENLASSADEPSQS
jgi:hypothetical protein